MELARRDAAAAEAALAAPARPAVRDDGVGAAERSRAAAEQAAVAAVQGALEEGRQELVARLRRDEEAAAYGAASAGFFDATRGGPPQPVQVFRPRPRAARAAP
jgi:hypothetical protein